MLGKYLRIHRNIYIYIYKEKNAERLGPIALGFPLLFQMHGWKVVWILGIRYFNSNHIGIELALALLPALDCDGNGFESPSCNRPH